MNLELFNTANLFDASTQLFQQLGIKLNSNTAEALAARDLLKDFYKDNDTFNAIRAAYFIGLIDDSVFRATGMFDVNYSVGQALDQADRRYEGLMLFALELAKQPTRTEISDITRAFNRISQKMPVALVFKYTIENETVISIAISERFKYLQNWRQGEKVGKVIILRDIHTKNMHAGHQRILLDLVRPAGVNNYAQLHTQWLDVLDVNILNKRSFQELANWYFWAMDEVQFPDDLEKNQEKRNSTNLIRLITRVIFIWFIKEKQLVPSSLFNKNYLKNILKDFLKEDSSNDYYKAILQNLFFATLNQKMGERDFADDHNGYNKEDQGIKTKYRYPEKFTISKKEILELFKDIPFLNGGLFDCLDKFDEEKLEKGKKDQLFTDGFTRIGEKQAVIPDFLFFGEETDVDLTQYFDPEAKKAIKRKVKGLIYILDNYKFTVAENTPLEEEIALDPELLGKVFENLLASYNPETKTTARKQTGSFYTPREIVNYMVDESLIEYLKQNTGVKSEDLNERLRNLISYQEDGNPFDSDESDDLIKALNNAKILDPACGSGAFPMGVLHKMVHLLKKLDPGNKKWKTQQREKIIGAQIKELEKDKKAIEGLSDQAVRERATQAVEDRLQEVEEIFESKNNFDDYARKLYLIENCIYGIDIQPIAVQISKLRFFISLIIDQDKDSQKENLGFRSLPNLETKFVAANTLIGLEKPQLKTGDIFIQDTLNLIKEKSDQLKDIRHKYFSARIRKDKLFYQAEDKKLRKEISELLVKIGHTKGNAVNIASFDPYDQNHFADWFEPEWMFGSDVKEGFDVVIGNPPYKVLTKNNTIKKELDYYNNDYKSFQGSSSKNLFTLFIEKNLKLLSAYSTLSFIIPEGLFKTRSYAACVKEINNIGHVKLIVTFSDYVFENAITGNLIFLFSKDENGVPMKYHFDKEYNLIETKERNNEITSKIEIGTAQLKEISVVFKGMVIQNRDAVISENPTGKKDVFLLGKNITKWKINSKFYTNYSDLIIVGGTKKLDKHKKFPRILIRRTGNTLCCAYLNERALTESTIYSCWSINEKITTKVILGLLNSKLLDYYNKEMFITNQQGFPQILMTDLELMPIKLPSKDFQKIFSNTIDAILLLRNYEKDSYFFERLMDAMVYELYLPEEIKAGGVEVLKYLNEIPELEDGQDEKNLRIIDRVYKELSDPKHPISASLLKLLTIDEINIIEGRA
ncbi:MAG TPA: TaqI-like C-terminal specificity domain-containing protein [Bacteroidales bacterium]|nr:TaqI-like C-terminal specificity domain-containing protein [Bacteroidales bacterium]